MYIFLFIIIFISAVNERNAILATLRRRKKNSSKGDLQMNELILKFIGKKCIIATMSNSLGGSVTGVIKEIREGWIEVETQNGQTDIINVDYIVRIREYPLNKKGKEKKIVLE